MEILTNTNSNEEASKFQDELMNAMKILEKIINLSDKFDFKLDSIVL